MTADLDGAPAASDELPTGPDRAPRPPAVGCLIELGETLVLTLIIFWVIQSFVAQPFKVEMGIIVADDTAAPEGQTDIKVRKADAMRCATILYTGPVNRQGEAYQKLIPALRAAGHTPTGEERESCLYWEGAESPNNVYLMMIAIK